MPGKIQKRSYILPHDLSGERQRLALMSELLDPMHRALLARIGLRPGWRCLEIGCGNGSISQWLATEVGPKGHVTATDLDLRYIDNLRAPNLEVRQLDILKDEIEPATYDLVTARAILHHVKSPKKAVQHMVNFLKPNGVLLSIEPDFLPATAATPEPLRAFWQAWLQWSSSVGIDYFIGRKMPALLSAAGLDHIGARRQHCSLRRTIALGKILARNPRGTPPPADRIRLRLPPRAHPLQPPLLRPTYLDQRNHLRCIVGNQTSTPAILKQIDAR